MKKSMVAALTDGLISKGVLAKPVLGNWFGTLDSGMTFEHCKDACMTDGTVKMH